MRSDTSDRWRFSADPRFESAAELDPAMSAWVGHELFAYDLVRQAKPRTIVELGTHAGYSFFALCQAVKDAGLPSSLFAVDTWTGDEQAGQYDEAVFDAVDGIVSRFYAGLKTQLLRMTFDEAVEHFEDASIDLLHIDGLHTYEAVSHDFGTWLPKMDARGIVLFHDIDETQDDFGVWRFWDEVKQDYETLEFGFGHGLGALFLDADTAAELFPHRERANAVRRYASAHAARLNAALTETARANQTLAYEVEAKEEYQRQAETIPGLRVEIERLADANEEALKGWREEASAREKTQSECGAVIRQHEALIVELTALARQHEATEVELTALIRQHEATEVELTALARQHEAMIAELTAVIRQHEATEVELRAEIERRGAAHEDALKARDHELSLREKLAGEFDEYRRETERLFNAWKTQLDQERAARESAEESRGTGE